MGIGGGDMAPPAAPLARELLPPRSPLSTTAAAAAATAAAGATPWPARGEPFGAPAASGSATDSLRPRASSEAARPSGGCGPSTGPCANLALPPDGGSTGGSANGALPPLSWTTLARNAATA